MTFTLYSFIFLFLVTLFFYGIRKVYRPYELLVASLIYIAYIDRNALISLALCTALVYAAGRLIEMFVHQKKNKLANLSLFVSVGLMIAVLLIFKFSSRIPVFSTLILPIGFSYYSFQAIGYLVDIAGKKTHAEKNPALFALYMCYFPKFVSGPIEREEIFIPQVKDLDTVRFRARGRLSTAIAYMLYGFFMKTVVADNLGTFVPLLFDGYESHSSLWLILGSLSYTMQIYCDFAGYSSIAIGVSKIFGIDLI